MRYVKELNSKTSDKPFLYSYRRCPYAMRARMAMLSAHFEFDIYEISLRDKPKEMLKISPKGTVPVLIIGNNIIDESLDIMIWAYNISDRSDHYISLSKSGMAHIPLPICALPEKPHIRPISTLLFS